MLPMSSFSLPGCEMTAMAQHDSVLTITACARAPTTSCPRCGLSSRRVHRHDTRQPRDLPRWDDAVRWVGHVRRVRCLHATCPAQTFAERLPPLVRSDAQRPVRLPLALPHLGRALGGAAGAWLCGQLQGATSPDTLLRLIRQFPKPPTATPTIIGVDDWAMRRGRTYGTLIGDRERQRPLDLWPDRTDDSLAAWLLAHPDVTILSRDRSTAYTRGATVGAPESHQVLDRWPLVHHRREALARVLDRRPRRLAA